jgi:O-antigen ligase
MIYWGILISVFLSVLAYKRPEICFALGFPAYLFLGQLNELYPVSNSAGAAIFPWVAFFGRVLRNGRILIGSSEKILIILALWMIYSITYSMYPDYGRDKVILFIFLILPFIVFAPQIITGIDQLKTVLRIFLITMILYSIFSLLSIQNIGIIDSRLSILHDETRSGQFLGLSALLLFVYFWATKSIQSRSIFYSALIIVNIIMLLMTGTRAAFLSLIFSLFFLRWLLNEKIYEKPYRQNIKIFLNLLIGTVSIVVIYFTIRSLLPDEIINRFTTLQGIFTSFSTDELYNWQFSRGRTLNYMSSIYAFLSHPIKGYGAGGYIEVIGNYILLPSNILRSDLNPMYPHNLILEFSVEQGVIGLSLILCVLFINLRMILTLRNITHAQLSDNQPILLTLSTYFYGLLLSMTALDVPKMLILWWGMGLLIATDRLYSQSAKRISEI